MYKRVALIAFAVASQLTAQAPASLEQRRMRVAESMARIRAAEVAMRRDSIRVSELPLVREYAGMQLRGDTTWLPRAFMRAVDASFQKVRGDAVALLGERAHAALNGMVTSLIRGEGDGTEGSANYVTLRTLPIGGRGYLYQTVGVDPPDNRLLDQQFQSWFEASAANNMPVPMRRWLGAWASLYPPKSMNSVFRGLASMRYKSSNACLNGSLRACRALMSIEPNNDTIATFLDPSERRERVSMYSARTLQRRFRNQPELISLAAKCAQGNSDEACSGFLRRVGAMGAIGREHRREVLRMAIAMGGPQAYERLIGTNETEIGRILEVTAGVPVDSLMSAWQTAVVNSKPNSPAPNAIEMITCLTLGLGAIGLAVGRRP